MLFRPLTDSEPAMPSDLITVSVKTPLKKIKIAIMKHAVEYAGSRKGASELLGLKANSFTRILGKQKRPSS